MAPNSKADYREGVCLNPAAPSRLSDPPLAPVRDPAHYTGAMAKTHHPGKILMLAMLLWLSLLCMPVAAQWMWRSADGRVNASDRPPPPGVAEKDIIKRPQADTRRQLSATGGDRAAARAGGVAADAASAPPLSPAGAASAAARAASAPATPLEKEAQARKLAAEREKAAKTKADEDRQAAARASNCRNARGALAAVESGTRLVRTNEKGEREVLDDRGRSEEQRRAQEAIASNCR